MNTKIALVVSLLIFLGVWFFLSEKSQTELFQVKIGDLNLSFSADYSFESQGEKSFSQNSGSLFPLVGDGEKVRFQDEVCIVQGESSRVYKAQSGGIVVFRAKGEVEAGALLFEIFPEEGTIEIPLAGEQASKVSGKNFLGLKFPFLTQEIWGEFQSLEKAGDEWKLTILTRDLIPELAKTPTGSLTLIYGSLKDVAIIPKKALSVKDGQLGVFLEGEGDSDFVPVEVLGGDGSNLAVSGVTPGVRVKVEP
ncbi:MAG: hypothetical protein NUV68_06570 [Caldiserica bacterium]|jgi:hypothetical protein|nr:hypothetical protein [Caldisericota bacterium]MDH7562984.1 hypothetical protein [Caldisericota bacterium]